MEDGYGSILTKKCVIINVRMLKGFCTPCLRSSISFQIHRAPNDKIGIGASTRRLLQKDISPVQKVAFFSDVKDAYAAVAKHLMPHLPLENHLLRRLRYLHPAMRQKESSVSSIKAGARKLPQVLSENDTDKLAEEWLMYQGEGEIQNSWFVEENEDDQDAKKYLRVDSYWAKVLDIKTPFGLQKYPTLAKLVKAVLALSHGQADVERGFFS